GNTVTISWSITNTGTTPTPRLFYDNIFVKNLTTGATLVNTSLAYDPSVTGNGAIQPGQSRARQYSFQMPNGSAGVGDIQFVITTDTRNDILEANPGGTAESNNAASLAQTSTLANSPDLVVSNLRTSPASGLQSGKSVTVLWDDVNSGLGTVAGSYHDVVVVRNTATNEVLVNTSVLYDPATAGNGVIAAGGTRARQYTFTLPDGDRGVGPLQITVTADYYNAVYETNAGGTAESNNATAITASSTIAPYADLTVANVTVSPAANLTSSGNVTIRWDDVNTGSLSTSNSFHDVVFVKNLTTGETLVNTSIQYDQSLAGNGPIAAGAAKSRQYTFKLPDGTRGAGDLQIVVTTDYYNAQYEYNAVGTGESNNSATVTATSVIGQYPDLRVSNLRTQPATGLLSGGTVVVKWDDANAGNGPSSGSFGDRLTVVNTTTNETLVSTLVSYDVNAVGNGAIAAGDSRARQFSFRLPDGVRGIGQLRITVDADYSANIFEFNAAGTAETNNSTTINVAATAGAYPDLQVVNLRTQPSSSITSGTTLSIQWDDLNAGNADVAAGYYDQVRIVNTTTNEVLVSTYVYQDPYSGGFGPLIGGEARARSYSFKLPDGARGVGAFQATVTTDALDGVFEFNAAGTASTNNASTVNWSSTLNAYPDLKVSSLDVTPATGLQSGGTLTVKWTDKNDGQQTTTGAWHDRVLVRNAATGVTLAAATVAYTGAALAANASVDRQFAIVLPNGPAGVGQIEVVVTVDQLAQIAEFNATDTAESNNAATTTVTSSLAGYPDLAPIGLTVSPASGIQTGDQLTATWSDLNQGVAPTGAKWIDRLFVKNKTTGATLLTIDVPYDPASADAAGTPQGAIAAGDSRIRSATFRLPDGSPAAGQIEFSVQLDATDAMYEFNAGGTGETNNGDAVTRTAALAPYPDLAVTAIVAPALTVADPARVTIGWTVANQGDGRTPNVDWVDTVFVSGDTTIGNFDDAVLGRFTRTGGLEAGATYTQSQSILLPPAFKGRFHLYVTTDSGQVVFENGAEANNRREAPQPFDVSPTPYADLAFTALNAPSTAFSGQQVNLSWTVINQGIGLTDRSSWTDGVFLASDPAGLNRVGVPLARVIHSGPLSPGDSYTSSATVTLPDGISGPHYLVVDTGGPYEFLYADNNRRVSDPVAVTLTVPPDLTVPLVVAPANAEAGGYVDISWKVYNAGSGGAAGSWFDSVSLQKVGAAETISLGSFQYTAGLGAGLFYERTEKFRMPVNTQGLYQVVVRTNASGSLFENGASANNTGVAVDPLTLALAPHPDLQVESITAPATAAAGGTLSLQYTIINQGLVKTSTPRWRDYVYLSLDNKITYDDVLLASPDNGAALEPGETYATTTASYVIPKRYRGPVFVIVRADGSSSVDEFPNEGNNDRAVQVDVTPLPPPDLVTSDVVAPSQAYDGSEIEVRYRVSNLGLGPTDVDRWTDTIWLTRDRRRPSPSKGDIFLGSVTHAGVLGTDPSVLSPPTYYEQTAKVTLPKHVSGELFITAWANPYGTVIED
ncbi:MAG TPA: CARDB domain-containing protein, partial [Pirellulaceae bacterium]|nr:CARDB domain-containing protein [Pirellulaceae bacterium]